VIVEAEDSGRVLDADLRAGAVVGVIRERDDGVEAVVPAGELQDDQDVVVGLVGAVGLLGEGELRDERGDGGGEADDGEGVEADFEEVATGGEHGVFLVRSGELGGRSPPYERRRRSGELVLRRAHHEVGGAADSVFDGFL
jgi:hypothetical protein